MNVVLTTVMGPPTTIGPGAPPSDWEQLVEGSYRIGTLLRGKDKWWHLLPNEPRDWKFTESWVATDYEDRGKVIAEAVADVTQDVIALLEKLRISTASRAGA